jgi:hypothetical protein
MEPGRDAGLASAATVATAIVIAIAVVAMVQTGGGMAHPLQAAPPAQATSAPPPSQG